MAVFDDRPDMLIFLHRSSTQIRAGYRTAYLDLLDEEEREHVTSISMQKMARRPPTPAAGSRNRPCRCRPRPASKNSQLE